MPHQDNRPDESPLPDGIEGGLPITQQTSVARLSVAHMRALDEAGAVLASQLNGALTALVLYMAEIGRLSRDGLERAADREYLRTLVESAVQQTERVCALVHQMSDGISNSTPDRNHAWERSATRAKDGVRQFAAAKRLTRREREVLHLISEGYSNKEGALLMRISPRTFESHRAEAMRKLGARNTADLVRAALLNPD